MEPATHEDSQFTPPPSSISRTLSAPSLGVSYDSPLPLPDMPSLRDAVLMMSPPQNQAFQRQHLDPSGSFSAEQMCRAAAANLDWGRKAQTAKLGAADPYVECLRTQAIDLRRRADHLKWNRLVAWHECNVNEALQDVQDGAE